MAPPDSYTTSDPVPSAPSHSPIIRRSHPHRLSRQERHRIRTLNLAHLDVLTGLIGAAICSVFVISMTLASSTTTATAPPAIPRDQLAGMLFTSLLCPLVFFGFRNFYLHYRVFFVLAVRCSFILGTAYNYSDTPRTPLPWPAFFMMLLYSSRSLVMAWGALGWQLPFTLHLIVLLVHGVAAATSMISPLCATSLPDSFVTLNEDKIRAMTVVLDWPFAVVWPPAPQALAALTSEGAACGALVAWVQAVVGCVLPTALLTAVSKYHWNVRWIRRHKEHVPLVVGMVVPGVWCIAHVVAIRVYAPPTSSS